MIVAMDVVHWLPRRTPAQDGRIGALLLPLMNDPRVYETRISPSAETLKFPIAQCAIDLHIFLFAFTKEPVRGPRLVEAAKQALSTEATAPYSHRLAQTKLGSGLNALAELFAEVFQDTERPVAVRIRAHQELRFLRSRPIEPPVTEGLLTRCAPLLEAPADPALKEYAEGLGSAAAKKAPEGSG
jgi:hypothetical protein